MDIIADTGRGMTRDQKDKAFDEGFTTKPLGEGTGLGLSISKEIVEKQHGGSIDFESEPGLGTTFHIRIPVRQGASRRGAVALAVAGTGGVSAGGGRPRQPHGRMTKG